jgi:hypothetical protein
MTAPAPAPSGLGARWARLTRFSWGWPSWITEALSGLLAVAVALLLVWALHLIDSTPGLLLVATALSVVYEVKVDVHGWSLADVAQREVGILAGVLLVAWLL